MRALCAYALFVPQQVQKAGPSRGVGLPLHVDTRTSTLGEIARSRELDQTRMVEADELTELVMLRDWLRYAVTRFNAVATFRRTLSRLPSATCAVMGSIAVLP